MQNLYKERMKEQKTEEMGTSDDSLVSFIGEVPEPLKNAMAAFIETHPNWDQYRLIQAALAGFLVQNGVESRSINRIYCQNMFSRKSFGKSL